MKTIRMTAVAFLLGISLYAHAQSWESAYEKSSEYTVESTTVCGRNATIIAPAVRNGKWIVRPAFMGAFPQVDEALLEKGWTFGYLDLTDEYANPDAQKAFDAFYDYARSKYSLSEKLTLEGLSRGGWFSLVYAVNNPGRIDKLYLDAPLCDLNLFKERMGEAYGLVKELWGKHGYEFEDIHNYPAKHIENIRGIPTIVVYGAADEICRFEDQFGSLNLSGFEDLSLIGKTGCGHHPHSLSPCDTIVNFITKPRALERADATPEQAVAFENYIDEVTSSGSDLHSIMVLQHGKVLFGKWMGEGAPEKPHKLFSCSKTFCAAAAGFAIEEGYFGLEDKVISFFPDKLPRKISKNLKAMTVRDLLTMTGGHGSDPTWEAWKTDDWAKYFFEQPVEYTPGTAFCYNSIGTFLVSAIIQKTTGKKLTDYLEPRLFGPLGISGASWEESPDGICCGGWGLSLKTEDMARMGQCLLDGGVWEGRQVIPAWWAEEMGKKQVESIPGGQSPDRAAEFHTPEALASNDWCQGYGYQMWMCRHGAYRADGASSQYIIVIPEKDAVIVTTAHDDNMQRVLDTIWKHILPVL